MMGKREGWLWCSILNKDSVVPEQNHSPIVETTVTVGGAPITVWVLRGTDFIDAEGNRVLPLGYLSNNEVLKFKSMLEHVDDNGVTIHRTLPMEWEVIDAMVDEMRSEDAETIYE